MEKFKWSKLTLGFRVAFWFQSHSLRLLWCGGGASSLNECGGGDDRAKQVPRWWRLGRRRRAVVAGCGLCGGRRLQVDGGPVVPLGGVELGLHCDLGY